MPENVVQHRNEFTHRGTRLLFALVLALGMTVFASMATQQSAHAAVAPAAFNLAHQCESFVFPNSNQAVVCSDINETAVSGGMEFWGTGEYFCQGPSVQCAGITASNNLLSEGHSVGNTPFQCTGSACPNGGRAMVSTGHLFIAAGVCVPATGTVDNSADILVNGESTAWHPPTLHTPATVCG